jgi:prepilin-type N-terminal cleavage/methylation domain-containing protein
MKSKVTLHSREHSLALGAGRGQKSGEDGFSLIEIIITLVVLSIAVVGVLGVFSTGIRSSANPLIIDQATQLAQGEMDRVLAEKALIGFFAPDFDPTNPTPCDSASIMPPGFSCTRTFDYVQQGDLTTPVTPTATEYIRVTVTISQAAIGSVSLVTLITNY